MLSQPGPFLPASTMKQTFAILLAVAASSLAPGAAIAAPATGFAQANVVTPGAIVPLNVLRFGQFLQPTTAGTLTVDIAGAVTTTGGVTGTTTLVQTGTGRGPGSFGLTGSPNRQTDIIVPTSSTITSGSQTMTVNAFTSNANGGGKLKLDATGYQTLIIGATLNVGANQAVGSYTGTYTITVTFQ
jgi:Domain of unknown function (DUF4402)